MGQADEAVLVLIGVQAAIDDATLGRRGQPEMESNIARLLAHWRAQGWRVIHVRHDSTEPDSPYRPGQPGNDFKPEAAPVEGEVVVAKCTNSAFIDTTLQGTLDMAGWKRLVVAGVLLENSVDATVRMAANLGYEVWLPADAVASIDRTDLRGKHWPAEDVHALSLAILDGEYCTVTTTEELLAG